MRSGFELLTNRIRSQYPGAAIAGAMVEKMAPKGLEVIIGMRRDPTFGPMMMFGMGGTLVEQLKGYFLSGCPSFFGRYPGDDRRDYRRKTAERRTRKQPGGY